MNEPFRTLLLALLITATIPTPLFAQEDATKEELLALLPQAETNGLKRSSEPSFYDPDNLWEYIDGAADFYNLYGFCRVVTADFAVGEDSSTVTVEIYRMESPLHAFGIYAAERAPEEPPAAVGTQGYLSSNVLNFYKGPYYVKITSFAFSKNLAAELERIGRAVADNIAGDFHEPELLQRFPPEKRVPYSERFIPSDFLGQSYLQNGYRCDYREGEESWQLFIVPMESDEAARAALKSYRRFLESQGRRILPQSDDETVIAEKEGFTAAFVFRSYLGGVLDGKSLERVQGALDALKLGLMK